MYDQNGLQLTEATETMNAYRLTSVDLTTRKYSAYARAARTKGNKQWSMYKIGTQYTDPRDAAYVAQEFEKKYTHDQVRQLVTDGCFYEVAREFASSIEIPEWKYPAEGLSIEDILSDYGYKVAYVSNAKDALKEVISVFKLKVPALKEIPSLLAKLENFRSTGITYRDAARKLMNV